MAGSAQAGCRVFGRSMGSGRAGSSRGRISACDGVGVLLLQVRSSQPAPSPGPQVLLWLCSWVFLWCSWFNKVGVLSGQWFDGPVWCPAFSVRLSLNPLIAQRFGTNSIIKTFNKNSQIYDCLLLLIQPLFSRFQNYITYITTF